MVLTVMCLECASRLLNSVSCSVNPFTWWACITPKGNTLPSEGIANFATNAAKAVAKSAATLQTPTGDLGQGAKNWGLATLPRDFVDAALPVDDQRRIAPGGSQ